MDVVNARSRPFREGANRGAFFHGHSLPNSRSILLRAFVMQCMERIGPPSPEDCCTPPPDPIIAADPFASILRRRTLPLPPVYPCANDGNIHPRIICTISHPSFAGRVSSYCVVTPGVFPGPGACTCVSAGRGRRTPLLHRTLVLSSSPPSSTLIPLYCRRRRGRAGHGTPSFPFPPHPPPSIVLTVIDRRRLTSRRGWSALACPPAAAFVCHDAFGLDIIASN
jgi:hypothetical protein